MVISKVSMHSYMMLTTSASTHTSYIMAASIGLAPGEIWGHREQDPKLVCGCVRMAHGKPLQRRYAEAIGGGQDALLCA